MKNLNDIFLSKWLNNQLSEEELKQFQASEDYDLYVKIIEGANKLQAPIYDLDASFSLLKEKRDQKPFVLKNKTPKKWWQYSAAASVILLIGFLTYFNFFSDTVYSSDFGKQVAFELPDGSKVLLNSKSTIRFNERNWDENRTLKLQGEAFFDVEKGNTFTVNTTQGIVSVLGTEFNVKAIPNFFEVTCYEGKVKVVDKTDASVRYLTPSLGYQNIATIPVTTLNFQNTRPEWLNHQSVFKSVPIKYVFTTLEKHYQLEFKYQNFDDTILFTGSFPNNNKEIALETVLKSVNLKYTIQGNSIILED